MLSRCDLCEGQGVISFDERSFLLPQRASLRAEDEQEAREEKDSRSNYKKILLDDETDDR
jgi:hypothetical protein